MDCITSSTGSGTGLARSGEQPCRPDADGPAECAPGCGRLGVGVPVGDGAASPRPAGTRARWTPTRSRRVTTLSPDDRHTTARPAAEPARGRRRHRRRPRSRAGRCRRALPPLEMGCCASRRSTGCDEARRRALRARSPSATRSTRCTPSASRALRAAEDRLVFGRMDLADEPSALRRADRAVRRRPGADALRLALPRGRAVLPSDRGEPARRHATSAPDHLRPDGHPPRGRRARPRRPPGRRRTCRVAGRSSPRSVRTAPGACATSSRRSRASRTASSARRSAGVLVVQGGTGLRQDRRGAAPGGLPALHAPRAHRAGRRARRRAQPAVPRATSSRCSPPSARAAPSSSRRASSTRGSTPARTEPPRPRSLKGDPRMARMVQNAVAALQRVPDQADPARRRRPTITLTPTHGRVGVAHAPGAPGSRTTRRDATSSSTCSTSSSTQLAQKTNVDVHEYRDSLLEDLRDSVDVRREINLCWMPLDPGAAGTPPVQRRPATRSRRPRGCRPTSARCSLRPLDAPWEYGDVPLLDEAAELLGVDDEPARLAALRAERETAAEISPTPATSRRERLGHGHGRHAHRAVRRSAVARVGRRRARTTAPGSSATSSSTRRRSSRPWRGASWRVAARRCR